MWHEVTDDEQLTEQFSRPFMLPTVPLQLSTGIPRTVELLKDNCDGSMLASTSGSMPSVLWIWQGFRSPLAVISFRDPIRQVMWHPEISDALLIVTASPQPRTHLWTKRNAPRGVPVTLLKKDATSGRPEVKWVQDFENRTEDQEENKVVGERDEDYLFVITNEKSFDIGFMETVDDNVKFRSVLNDAYLPDAGAEDDGSEEEMTTPSGKRVNIHAEHRFSTDGDPRGILAQAPYHRWGHGKW